MNLQDAIATVIRRQNLTRAEMQAVMRCIMTGEATQSQIGGFLVGLRMKGETVDEITAAVSVMRDLATNVTVSGPHLVDTCGTGGDGARTFNISTASAFVAAAAGAKVAKHGNRSISSKSGSADVLEAAGVNLDLTSEQVAECVTQVGLGFMFAPKYHSAMKHAIGPRKEMGVRTLFNLLGPLTNPAGAPNQVLGVFSEEWLEPLAKVLGQLGSEHVLVVHAEDGMDEISIGAATKVVELKNGKITIYKITPEQFGFDRADVASLAVDNAQQSLAMIHAVFSGSPGPALDIVLLNAGASIYAAGLANSIDAGIHAAKEALISGAAENKLQQLIAVSNQLGRIAR
ncbi:MAG: anthranilate phosphoribosyltransferase [Gammaproteobacteria bacterium]|nr:anthranilate phosphoribosyltransferase [Gammaproteobacteria bacterium]